MFEGRGEPGEGRGEPGERRPYRGRAAGAGAPHALYSSSKGARDDRCRPSEAPPHFHVLSAESSAKIRIDTLEVLAGRMKRTEHARVIAWASRTGPCSRRRGES
ncbi:DUF4160 domain-containing protein [Salinarimonas sp.]|uniref:DUF4160 domain-containing protein n=1 Tax=Salinarimonas sp. TaxID=2766526 RepID=UPI0035B56CC9